MKKRILSMMLALLMAFGSFGVFCTMPGTVMAADNTTAGDTTTGGGTTGGGTGEIVEEPYVEIVAAAIRTNYESPEDKLQSDENMRLAAKYGQFELYVNDYTGEIGVKDTVTGQILLSNPYKIENTPTMTVTDQTRAELMSQIVLGFIENGNSKVYNSYTEAAARGQIKVKNIKQGIRVEYALGREDANYLAPGSITIDRMVSQILSIMYPGLPSYTWNDIYNYPFPEGDTDAYNLRQFLSYYTPIDPFATDAEGNRILGESAFNEVLKAYPVLQKLQKGIYVRSKSTARDKRMLENYIKTYCPNYTYEEMEKDHAETEYTSEELDPPLFKLALEYTLTSEGLTIRLPANGIRFDYSLYTLEYVSPLQYFGAGDMNEDGYLFYPDGSGAILYYEDLVKKESGSIPGKVYGTDYAYHQIPGTISETIRMPVFGAISGLTTTETAVDAEGNEVTTTKKSLGGYLAILEEGDAMANITASWGGGRHAMASVYTTFYPRPKDTYDLSGDSSSSGSGSSWTVESSRKYTGSYKMRIYMLSDQYKNSDKGFDATYVGMANAYRHYLTDVAGLLSALTVADEKNIPLYIESFGTVPDIERILTIPINVDVPLTTFDDVKRMYADLSANGITNVHFKLTGFANEGMNYLYPNQLKWMKEVGGDRGFESLLEEAKKEGFGVYPDFDFMYITNRKLFDGINLKKAAARTIDNRYSNRRVYDATYQEFVSYFEICVTPSMIEEYYAKFAKKFKSFDPIGISVGTLGSDLNSDFGKKNPTNRDEAKTIITDIFKQLHTDYNGSVMTSGGNIYALAYTEHLLNAAVDSSRFASASRAVPFVGMVLHGYVNFAGSAINMAGNVNYQVLKAIESGAGIYFTLSYDNTSLLKEDEFLSQYYSVNYKIWAGSFDKDGNLIETGELFDVYNRVNDAIGTLQTKKIVDHGFLIGERVPTDAEREQDAAKMDAAWAKAEALATTAAKKQQLAEYREKFANGEITAGEVIDAVADDEAIREILEQGAILTTESEATDGDDYVKTKYTLDDGMIVMVSYEGGTSFILNYNIYTVQVRMNGTVYTIEPYGYQLIKQ